VVKILLHNIDPEKPLSKFRKFIFYWAMHLFYKSVLFIFGYMYINTVKVKISDYDKNYPI